MLRVESRYRLTPKRESDLVDEDHFVEPALLLFFSTDDLARPKIRRGRSFSSTGKEATMKSPMRVLCVLALAAGLATLDAGRTARADGRCHKVSGAITTSVTTSGCLSPVGLCTAGEFTGDGLLNGTTTFVADGLAVSAGMPGVVPPSTLSYSGHLTITHQKGNADPHRHRHLRYCRRPFQFAGRTGGWHGSVRGRHRPPLHLRNRDERLRKHSDRRGLPGRLAGLRPFL